MLRFKGAHFAATVILTYVQRYVTDPRSYRQFEAMTQERAVSVDLASLNR